MKLSPVFIFILFLEPYFDRIYEDRLGNSAKIYSKTVKYSSYKTLRRGVFLYDFLLERIKTESVILQNISQNGKTFAP